jgi:hypothetical protein
MVVRPFMVEWFCGAPPPQIFERDDLSSRSQTDKLPRVDEERWLGIDFSGNHAKWRPGCTTSNVWIAELRPGRAGALAARAALAAPCARGVGATVHVHDLRRVQQIPGRGDPFDRLVALLASARYVAAGIDAPFSIPDAFAMPAGGHAALLSLVGGQPVVGRPFLEGTRMVRLVAGVAPPLRPPKPMRHADSFWTKRGVNVRSPLWTGARPGAPMTAACLTLLYRAARPMWPWARGGRGLLVEAFPAGQLETWGLPHWGYDGASPSAVSTRTTIADALVTRGVRLGRWRPALLASADALDAVVCALAAIAASTSAAPLPQDASVAAYLATEGWVAVHP